MESRRALMSDQDRLKDFLKKLAETQTGGLSEAQWENDFEQLLAIRFEAAEVGTGEDREAEMLERVHAAERARVPWPPPVHSPHSRMLPRKWIGFAAAGAVVT